MGYSEYGIADLSRPTAELYHEGWSVADNCLEPKLYANALDEATICLGLFDANDLVHRGYMALSPTNTPVNWHVANALSLQLSSAMRGHDYQQSLDYTDSSNNAHLAYRKLGFEMDPHKDESEIGVVISFCLSSGSGNAIQVEQEAGSGEYRRIEQLGNRAILLAGNDFGNKPAPLHYVPATNSPRINILLSHHDPKLWQ